MYPRGRFFMLFTKEKIENHPTELKQWQRKVYHQFVNMMTSRERAYPCVPGIQGFINNMHRYSFIEDPLRLSSAEQLADCLKEYGEVSRETGPFSSLIIFCDTRRLLEEKVTLEEYEKIFWSLLNQTHKKDSTPWPEHIPTDPEDHSWEFCFDGEPYFAFCATPAHNLRASRHFPCLLLAFQPRWVFDEINETTPFGRKIKRVIRKRLKDFDKVPPHPSLKWYGQKDNHEWKQYFLRDDHTSISSCPFMAMKNKWNSLHH